MTKPKLRIGLIGSGFMGKAHAFGYATATRVFDLPYELELHTIADVNDVAAKILDSGILSRRYGRKSQSGNTPSWPCPNG